MTAMDIIPYLDDRNKYRVEVKVIVPNSDTTSELEICTIVPTQNGPLTRAEIAHWLDNTFAGCEVNLATISHDSGAYPTIKLKIVHQFGSRRKVVIHT